MTIPYEVKSPEERTSDVYQTVVYKVCMDLAVDVASLSPPDLMHKYDARNIRVEHLRKAFNPQPPYINGSTTNEELVDQVAALLWGALITARGDDR